MPRRARLSPRSRRPSSRPSRALLGTVIARVLPHQPKGHPLRVEVAVRRAAPHNGALGVPGLPPRADELLTLGIDGVVVRQMAPQNSTEAKTADATNTAAARHARGRSPLRSAPRSSSPPRTTPPMATTKEIGYTLSSKVERHPSPSSRSSTRAPITNPTASPKATPTPRVLPRWEYRCRENCPRVLTRSPLRRSLIVPPATGRLNLLNLLNLFCVSSRES